MAVVFCQAGRQGACSTAPRLCGRGRSSLDLPCFYTHSLRCLSVVRISPSRLIDDGREVAKRGVPAPAAVEDLNAREVRPWAAVRVTHTPWWRSSSSGSRRSSRQLRFDLVDGGHRGQVAVAHCRRSVVDAGASKVEKARLATDRQGVVAVDCRFALVPRSRSSAPDRRSHPGQLADPGVRLGDVSFLLALAVTGSEHARSALEELALPRPDHVRVDVEVIVISATVRSPVIASVATLALKAGEWLRCWRHGIRVFPPRSAAAEHYQLSGCPISIHHIDGRGEMCRGALTRGCGLHRVLSNRS